eukprot:TRINITY_DN46836_c0_g1_i1.p1 TRINITY_DN46836_c0_g1~~TRINITY_DN46836_c0_g1_i1.p1  ORF type:complete len:224 (+),score=59.47 TRINITY_DN46836_c0_g1_i1:53-724(+)
MDSRGKMTAREKQLQRVDPARGRYGLSGADENRRLANPPTMLSVDFDAYIDSVAVPVHLGGADPGRLYRGLQTAFYGCNFQEMFDDIANRARGRVRGTSVPCFGVPQFKAQLVEWGIEFSDALVEIVLDGLDGEKGGVSLQGLKQLRDRTDAHMKCTKELLKNRQSVLEVPPKGHSDALPSVPPSAAGPRRSGADVSSVKSTRTTSTTTTSRTSQPSRSTPFR